MLVIATVSSVDFSRSPLSMNELDSTFLCIDTHTTDCLNICVCLFVVCGCSKFPVFTTGKKMFYSTSAFRQVHFSGQRLAMLSGMDGTY